MKRWLAFVSVFALLVAALVVAQRRRPAAPVSPDAVLYMVADTQRELSRLPVSVTRLSDAEEIQIGATLVKRYRDLEAWSPKNADTIAIENYLTEVGSKVAAHAQRKLPYSFHYIPGAYFDNAFALPGGPVYIGAGLISMMDSEDQLAAVLAHEVEHIDRGHAAERAQFEARMRRLGLMRAVVMLPVTVFQAGYSKEQELEADREGVRLAVQASYSPEGAVRMFEAFAREHHEEQFQAAKNPQQEITRVAMQTVEGYFRTHPSSSERASRIRELIATEQWPAHSERDLRVGYVFWQQQAARLLAAGKYEQARKLQERALKVKPDYPEALRGLAEAEFAMADFASAAANYRRLLDSKPTDHSALSHRYAVTLAAADRRTAARTFAAWTNKQPTVDDMSRADLAGLQLLAGDARPSAAFEAAVLGGADADPQLMAVLGRWQYLAGNSEHAHRLLARAAQQRPADAGINLDLVWAAIEQRRYADAIVVAARLTSGNDTRMAMAIARWLARQPDDALGDFEAAMQAAPQWENPQWVSRLYSPTVVKCVAEMQAERERRKQELEQRRIREGRKLAEAR